MTERVNTPDSPRRAYRSRVRAEQAAATRQAIVAAARGCFIENGYAATTVRDIARRASVAVDTVYATVGRKPALMREVVEAAISGTDGAVPARQREYVQRIRETPDAVGKLRVYAAAVAEIQPRLAPVYLALRDASATDEECAAVWERISERRAANMREFIADLSTTGEVRRDVAPDRLADVVWSMNSPEHWLLLVRERNWTADEFAGWLADAWTRLLLDRPS